MNIKGVKGLNFGNPEMQNWNNIYEKSQMQKIVLLFDNMIPIDIFKDLNQGVIMKIIVPSLEEGKRVIGEYN